MKKEKDKIKKIKKHLVNIENELLEISNIISEYKVNNDFNTDIKKTDDFIEGFFDGKQMIAKNGKKYEVPENYASKSKLVDGDKLKLIIAKDGRYTYKQIEPIKRKRKEAILIGKIKNDYFVKAGKKKYKVLKASVTYFKLKPNDNLIISIPNEDSLWAAIENKI